MLFRDTTKWPLNNRLVSWVGVLVPFSWWIRELRVKLSFMVPRTLMWTGKVPYGVCVCLCVRTLLQTATNKQTTLLAFSTLNSFPCKEFWALSFCSSSGSRIQCGFLCAFHITNSYFILLFCNHFVKYSLGQIGKGALPSIRLITGILLESSPDCYDIYIQGNCKVSLILMQKKTINREINSLCRLKIFPKCMCINCIFSGIWITSTLIALQCHWKVYEDPEISQSTYRYILILGCFRLLSSMTYTELA